LKKEEATDRTSKTSSLLYQRGLKKQ